MAITAYSAQSPKVRVPDTIEGEPVVSIAMADKIITELILPDTVHIVNLYSSTGDLEYVNLPAQLKSTFPSINDLRYVGNNLIAAYISYGLIRIPSYAFYNSYNLTSVTIPDRVTEIGESAFYDCENLTNATYKGVTYSYDNIEELYAAINGN